MTCVAEKRACALRANPLSNHQSPKILFPGPLIQPVNSSETKIKRPTYYRYCKAILGFTVLVLVFLFFVFFYWWIRVRHFHISHNAPYLPPTPKTMLLQNFFLWGGWANKVHYGQSQGISVTPLFAVVLGTTVGRDAMIGQLIQETKFKVLLMFDHQSFHIGSRRLH